MSGEAQIHTEEGRDREHEEEKLGKYGGEKEWKKA